MQWLSPLVARLFHAAHAAAVSFPYNGFFVAGAVFYCDAFYMGVQLSENLNGSFGISLKSGIGYGYIAAGSVFVWLNVDAVLRVCAACIVKFAVVDRNIAHIRDREIVSAVVMEVTVGNGYTVAAFVWTVIKAQIYAVTPALGNINTVDGDIRRTGYINPMAPLAAASFVFPALANDLPAGDADAVAAGDVDYLIIFLVVRNSN